MNCRSVLALAPALGSEVQWNGYGKLSIAVLMENILLYGVN